MLCSWVGDDAIPPSSVFPVEARRQTAKQLHRDLTLCKDLQAYIVTFCFQFYYVFKSTHSSIHPSTFPSSIQYFSSTLQFLWVTWSPVLQPRWDPGSLQAIVWINCQLFMHFLLGVLLITSSLITQWYSNWLSETTLQIVASPLCHQYCIYVHQFWHRHHQH